MARMNILAGALLAARALFAATTVTEGVVDLPTYPFSDPDPVPCTAEKRYPYFRFDGSTATAVCIALVERYLTPAEPLIPSLLLSATVGALILAVAGGVLFFVGSSSGGTDIVALIVQRFSRIRNIGRALFVTDVLIVLVGGILTNVPMLLCSLLGLFLKTLGIDALVALLARLLLLAAKHRAAREQK